MTGQITIAEYLENKAPEKRCGTCEHYQMITAGYKACVAFTISPSIKPDDVCDKWEGRIHE